MITTGIPVIYSTDTKNREYSGRGVKINVIENAGKTITCNRTMSQASKIAKARATGNYII